MLSCLQLVEVYIKPFEVHVQSFNYINDDKKKVNLIFSQTIKTKNNPLSVFLS